MLTRRTALATGAATLLAAAARPPRPLFGPGGLPLGINLYMLAGSVAKDMEGTLRQVAAIGYREVEFNLDAYPAERWSRALAAAGLRCASLGVLSGLLRGGLNLTSDPGPLADVVRQVGADYLSCILFPLPAGLALRPKPGEGPGDMMGRIAGAITADDWRRSADLLNERGAALKRHGVRLAYHNHSAEFLPHGDANGLTILLEHTDPALVAFHMDAGWVVAAGHDPAELIRAYPRRFRLMHVKDVDPSNRPNTAMRAVTTPVGQGIVDWRRVLGVAAADGMRHFAVEQEPPFLRPELENARASFDYLSRLAV